jgi:lipopolysaccharide transport system ATP-binding protein
MSETAIEIRNLKKYYNFSEKKGFSFLDLPDIIRNRRKSEPVIRVLDGIDLDILKGECFGIIGPNGTGKSTLLRLISGIIPPDSGSVTLNGSLIPLLNLSVGFSSELNAHDNVYQYGMVLGFSKKEMDALYDDIIAFSGLQKYQEMALKNFSSGMRVKLAFSTAVRIDPDILVLDEVLSVGDVSFKEKSQKKILEFCNSDKTVVIVSHSMSTISKLCDRAMFLKDGKIASIGETGRVIDTYLDTMQEHLEPKEITFTQKLKKDRASRENNLTYVHRVIQRVSEVDIFPIVRKHYNPDIERSLNEFLTWENLKKVSELEELVQEGNKEFSAGKTAFGSSAVSFLRKLGDESASRGVADAIVRQSFKDGIICFGEKDLTTFFSGSASASGIPGKIATLLIRDGTRTIPVLCDIRQIKKIDDRSVLRILKNADCNPASGVTLVLSPELFTDDRIVALMDKETRFLAPVLVQEIEAGNVSPSFFEGIVSPENMIDINDSLVFAKKGRFEIKGRNIDGYGYFNPRSTSPDYNEYFRRLAAIKRSFETTVRPPSITPETYISKVAKKDSVYFSGIPDTGDSEISFNREAVLKRQKLMGVSFLYHSGIWDAEECFRNYDRWWKTEKIFNYYRQIITTEDAFHRGKILVSLINTVVRLGII